MGKVYLWPDPNAASTFLSIKKKLNTVLLLPTYHAESWKLEVRIYRRRTDIKPQTAFDAIVEMDENLMAELMAPIDRAGSTDEKEVVFALAYSQNEEDGKTVWAVFQGRHTLKLSNTDISTVEAIMNPKKDSDYRLRQAIRFEGWELIGDGIRVALVNIGSAPAAVLVDQISPLVPVDQIIPTDVLSTEMTCNHITDYIDCIYKAKIM